GALQCITCHNPHSPKIGGQREPAASTSAGAPAAVEPAAAARASARVAALTAPCAACHGTDGRGAATYPSLAGSERAVLARQLQGYRSGTLQDPMMNAIASSLSDEDIADLSQHYASLPAGPTR
ncbi:MAG: c-type cytochrome, partial [Woeseia sp.]